MRETGSVWTIFLPGLYTAMPKETLQEKMPGCDDSTIILPEAWRDVYRHIPMPLLKSEMEKFKFYSNINLFGVIYYQPNLIY